MMNRVEDLTVPRQPEVDHDLIQRTFEGVVSSRVRDRLLADPNHLRLDGVRQPVTILFAAIHEFTLFSERTPPHVSFEVLNGYLSHAATAILDEEGTLTRFVGDAVTAVWNAPDLQEDHALRAVRAASAIDRAIKAHRTLLDYTYRLYFSFGIATGEAALGNAGAGQLFHYTAIGDTVDLAQRLESIARPGQILLAYPTYREIADRVIAREVPLEQIEGLRGSFDAYELLSDVF
jgi:class 3 adenylate cyclase